MVAGGKLQDPPRQTSELSGKSLAQHECQIREDALNPWRRPSRSTDEATEPDGTIVLTEAPVVLQARWDLNFGSCKSRGISKFEAQVFDADGETIMTTSLPCQTVGTVEGEYRIMPDDDRELVNPPIDHIMIQPLNKKKQSFGEPFQVIYDEIEVPGPGEAIKLTIRCTLDLCYVESLC